MSYVDAEEEARKEQAKKDAAAGTNVAPKPDEYPLISAIDRMGSAIATQLGRIADTLEGKDFVKGAAKPTPPVKAPEAAKTVDPPKAVAPPAPKAGSDSDTIKALFPQELEALLNFEVEGTNIRISPKKFLGSDNFAKIASVVRNVGGEYRSDGRNSHFIVPQPK